ncbi:hypothetical protein KDA23_07080, partial [Candidatus Saccharibacteria bacterium]|nr:hypothetical protein [Candidatus Saccharibacteria bacterium]
MDPETIQSAVDHAAVQSDRWLFLATLVVVGVCVFLLTRWMIGQLARRDTQAREDRAELVLVIKENAIAMTKNAESQ